MHPGYRKSELLFDTKTFAPPKVGSGTRRTEEETEQQLVEIGSSLEADQIG